RPRCPPSSGCARARRASAADRRTRAASARRIAWRSDELRQEAQIALVEQAQVVDAVAEHRQPVGSEAEGEADVAFGIDAAVREHVGMRLARAGDLEPARLSAHAAARAAAEHAAHVDLGRGLGEREERGAEARADLLVLEELAQEIGE